MTRFEALLKSTHARLAGVTIECLPWQTFLSRWDRSGMLFYLDPPYWGNESDYGPGVFSRADFAALAQALKGLQGRFTLSLNDRPEVRETFKAFAIEGVDVTYSIAGGKGKAVKEVIVTG